MVKLIPRLVLDENEVSKIIHDDCGHNRFGENDESKVQDERKNYNNVCGGTTAEFPQLKKVCQLIVSLPQLLRQLRGSRTQASSKLPACLGCFVRNLNFNMAEFHEIVAASNPKCKSAITVPLPNRVETIEVLPYRDMFQWRHLFCVLVVMILCPLIGEVVFFLPMNSVNLGPEENKIFIYGIMTLYQLFIQLPCVETCNFAMPQVKVSIHARLVALFVGLTIAKLIDVALTIGIFTYEPVFPIPFSILITGTLGTLPVVPILYIMTSQTERKLGNFPLMNTLLIAYWVALLVVIGWAIGIQRLQGKVLQYLVLFSYAVLRFGCKILLCANISTRLEPKRHIQLNLVVDILFTRVQVATWPFIDSPFTLMALFASESSVILWRYYDGVDRIQLWLSAILTTVSSDQDQNNISKRRRMKGITEACFMASKQYIINMSLSEDKSDIIQNLTICKTSSSPNNSSSTTLNGTRTDYDQMDVCSDKRPPSEFRCKGSQRVTLEPLSTTNDITLSYNDIGGVNIPENIYLGAAGNRIHGIQCLTYHDYSEDDDSSMASKIEENGVASIFRRPIDDYSASSIDIENNSTENSYHIEIRNESPPRPPTASKENWLQRDLYHMVDSTGSLCINIIVRINQQLIFLAVRNLPSSQHLNESFQISDERWREAQIYGSVYIILMLLLVIGISFSSAFFSEKKGLLDGKKLSLGRILSYLFVENFWHFFFWLISTGALVSSAMVNHFGADFSMTFKYLSCLDAIEWPGCSSH